LESKTVGTPSHPSARASDLAWICRSFEFAPYINGLPVNESIAKNGVIRLPKELSARAFTQADALVPLFLDDGIRLQQVASGVVIRLAEAETFILCAAHVTDLHDHGTLCVPTTKGIVAIKGMYGGVRLPCGMARTNDRDDVAYVRLDPAFAEMLDSRIHPLGREDVHFHETLVEGDIYTFGGYPISKSKTCEAGSESEPFLYTGAAAALIKYQNLAYDSRTHVLINFNRKTSRTPDGTQRVPPHPKGISGGGVFAWRKDWAERRSTTGGGHLVAIGHTYLKRHHCLVGTRIHLHLYLIATAFPHLVETLKLPDYALGVPLLMTLIWYPREEWNQLRLDFVDADKYPLSWNEWRHRAETGLETLGSRGTVIIPIELSHAEIVAYCGDKRIPNSSQARLTLANEKLMRQVVRGNL
jgi:hypothetical protein